MDALSKIFDDIHMSHAEYVYVTGHEDWHMKLDTQGQVAFHIILFGHCLVQLQNQPAQSVQGGDIIIISSGQEHRLYFSSPNAWIIPPHDLLAEFKGHRHDPVKIGDGNRANCLVLSIRCNMDSEMARPLLSALPPIMFIQNAMGEGAPPWLKIGLQFLALEAERTRPGRDTLMNRLVDMLLIECVRDYIEQLPEGSDNWLTALRDPQLAPVLSAIHAEPHISWTVADLALLAHMSRSSFAERFNEKMGETPLAYLSALRLRLAAWNLRENDLSVARISEKVGYSSETAFSQAFKRQYGLSPSQYRKQMQESLPA